MRTRRCYREWLRIFTPDQSLAELDVDATSVAPEGADVGGVVTA
ncbi:hypothetical protein O9993_15170 [Vibrio lentus]|nr:hypothetical protein [Vibrio lentus]